MEERSKKASRLSMENQKKVYAFLSKTIYDELIEYGVNEEYTFPFSLYLHWVIVKEYTKRSQKDDIESILKSITLEVGKEAYNQDLTNSIDALFADNSEILISIYKDVYQTDLPLAWLQEWQSLCKFCYATNKSKIRTCLTLLRIVNDCLNISHYKLDISLNILLRIEKNSQGMIRE